VRQEARSTRERSERQRRGIGKLASLGDWWVFLASNIRHAVAMTTTGVARNGDVEISYEVLGPPDGQPLLLVMGLGMQRIFWPDEFCQGLIDRGFTITRFDNRDAGESTHFRTAGRPSMLAMFTRPETVAPYRLDDMADDAVAVLDAVDWPTAHVAGASMGGMIAQTLAIRHPERVRTLTSIMSTPAPRVGRASLKAAIKLGRAGDIRTPEQAAERMVDVFRTIGSPGYPLDEVWLRDIGHRAFHRGQADPGAIPRQLSAINASGDRRIRLAGVRVPTLVIHGESDPLVRPAGGRATAAAVPGARLVTFAGMGHDMPRELWSAIQDEIAKLADQ
jgi:pimeloyl-ACP methyl ester carboxylesterase